jgi:hypothetical protein
MYDHEDRMNGTVDWLARCLVAVAELYAYQASITISLADGIRRRQCYSTAHIVSGSNHFWRALVYGHASDSDICSSVELTYSTVYYLIFDIPLNFSLIVQLTRKFYSCELSRGPPRPPAAALRQSGFLASARKPHRMLASRFTGLLGHGALRGTVGLHE